MRELSRREFLELSGAAVAARALAQDRGERPKQEGATVLNPRARVPVSLLVDDSTCLVNLAHFCIPQFAHVRPGDMKQDWRKLPREIPDAFVRKFGEWCRGQGVKGKYSVIPFPACVGWIDREMPGWTRSELDASLALLRDFMAADWDFTPEMVTHTRVIDPKTGKPFETYDLNFMENWEWSQKRSADELAEYVAYALRALRNAGLPCQGVTSPGGFGGKNLANYSRAVLQAHRDVFKTEIPFYLKKVYTDERDPSPEVLYASGLDGDDPKAVVSVIGCTGDWFGGWDGLEAGSVDKFITEDLRGGRLPQVIAKGRPAVLVSHWPGMYFNGDEVGFKILQGVVSRLHAAYDNLIWMRFSELSRYWAAKELTTIGKAGQGVSIRAPFSCPAFTLRLEGGGVPSLTSKGEPCPLKEVANPLSLAPGTWARAGEGIVVCFDLAKGESRLDLR